MEPDIQQLLQRYVNNELDEAAQKRLNDLIKVISDEELIDLFGKIDLPLHLFSNNEEAIEIKLSQILNRLNKQVPFQRERSPSSNVYGLFIKFAAAACLMALGVYGILQIRNNTFSSPTQFVLSDVDPAQSLANLVLDNGDTISLDSYSTGILYERNGLKILKKENGQIVYIDSAGNDVTEDQYISVHTPKGGYTDLTLADGTKVKLNSGASIRYPLVFSKKERLVEIIGEAYLDVAHDANKPFKIKTYQQVVEVLGTSLNIKSSAQLIKTTLVEGSIKLHIGTKNFLLTPGQQASVSNNDEINIKNVNLKEVVSWKNNQFVFENTALLHALKDIENWYDVQFIINGDFELEEKLFGTVNRDVKLSELLKVIELNTNHKFEIKGRRVFIKQ